MHLISPLPPHHQPPTTSSAPNATPAPPSSLRCSSHTQTALREGNSLLPVGVTAVSGEFQRGDVVRIVNVAGTELGRGLAEYTYDEANELCGHRSEQIEEILGYRGRSVIVHRDELVLFDNDE